jgi:hypothetical protein
MPTATGLRKKLNPALLAGAPYREGEVMAGRYQVKDAVGVGPLGFVLRAADRELGIDVSVKLIHPRFVQTGEEREAFARALDPARRFLHPSLTRLHDVGNDQGWPYFTYTFLDGLPLRRIIDSRLAKGQTFALDEVEPILGQLMSALEAAHPAGAHGDLKAENILVLPDMLKVTDWGVAAGVPRPPFVQAERQKAVHRHLAPEYLAGLALDPRADVYSLGVLVGEMLTGLTPEDELPELRQFNPDLPDAIEGFYRRALSERPETRYRSVREMFEAFSAVVEGKPSGASDEVVEDGFEVVDFVETQIGPPAPPPSVAGAPPEPEPEPAEPAPAPVEPDPRAALAEPEPAPVRAEPEPEPELVAVHAALEPVAVRGPMTVAEVLARMEAPAPEGEVPDAPTPEVVAAPAEGEFWAEAAEAAEAAAAADPTPPSVPVRKPEPEPAPLGTLWSGDDDEAEAMPGEPDEPLVPAAAHGPGPAASAREVAAEPAARPPPTGPRIVPSLSHGTGIGPRPVVPAVGIWGPGARRTGAHAAVAVAESAPAVEPMAAARTQPPPPIRPVPTPPPAFAPRVAERTRTPLGTPSVAPLAAVAPPATPLAAVPEAPIAAPPAGAHQGGLWSPGAALAELVSEIQAEDARRTPEAGGGAVPAAELAARAVAEQRPARERLALMSASEDPTAPVPSVSGRPRRSAPAAVARPWLRGQRDRYLRWGLLLAVFFAVGMFGAVMLSRAH